MKRRNLILSFIVVALLLIGVGYAALTETLTIGGTIETSVAEFDVIFSQVKKGDATVDGAITNNGHTITLNHEGLTNAGDSVVFTVTVKNNSEQFDARLGDLTLTIDDAIADKNYFSIESTYVAQKLLKVKGAAENADSYTFTITVTLIKVPDTEDGVTGTITGSLTGTAVERSN